MGIKTVKPTSPGRRGMMFLTFEEISRSRPEKSLVRAAKKHAGRNNSGRVTVRHQGGGAKRAFRLIDFRRDKDGIPARVASIEYDPNRSARIALLHYADGEKRYILAPDGLTVGMTVMSGEEAEIRLGNCLPLRSIPVGSQIHNVELQRGRGGQIVRSAGSSAQLMAKEGNFALLRLPSGEVRKVPVECRGTLGQVSNVDHKNISLGKAGRKRHRGIRPTVRGVVMNAVDHPHGGGEGKSPIGGKPQTPWGKPAMGYKTRRSKKKNPLIVSRRKKG